MKTVSECCQIEVFYLFHLSITCHKMYIHQNPNAFCFLVIILFSFFIPVTYSEKDITISIAPGREECFYESLKNGQVMDIDYQVIDGGQGALDISFYLESPNGRTIVMDYKKPEKSHRIEINEDGDYKLCFDNRFSSFNTKTVYFEIIVESEDGRDLDMWELFSSQPSPEEQYEMTIQDIEESVNRVKSHLLKIRHLQEALRAYATRDKNVLEGNFFKVNSWSILQVVVMVLVGIIQVVMVKSLFDEESTINKIWKKSVS